MATLGIINAPRGRVRLPIQVARGAAPGRSGSEPLRIRGASDASGGWAVLECDTVAEARAFMRAYPSAAMPCWRRPDLFAAEEAAERAASQSTAA